VSGKKIAVRHMKKRACVVNTMHGEVQLDETGGVTNLDELECTAEELCEVPNFIDGAIFGGKPESDRAKGARLQEEEKNGGPPVAVKPAGPSDQEYGDIIADLISDGAACTSEGYIQMDVLNGALREKEMPIISGTRRKEISDAWSAPE